MRGHSLLPRRFPLISADEPALMNRVQTSKTRQEGEPAFRVRGW